MQSTSSMNNPFKKIRTMSSPLAILVVFVATFSLFAAQVGLASAKPREVKVFATLTVVHQADGSVRARAVYKSKVPECITASIVRSHDAVPFLYEFNLPGMIEISTASILYLPRVSPHTYEVKLPGTYLVAAKFESLDPKAQAPEIRWLPLSEATLVGLGAPFVTSSDSYVVNATEDGHSVSVTCTGTAHAIAWGFPLESGTTSRKTMTR